MCQPVIILRTAEKHDVPLSAILSTGDAAYELPLNITTQLNGRTSYTLTVTAVNCNGQTGMVCNVHIYMLYGVRKVCVTE